MTEQTPERKRFKELVYTILAAVGYTEPSDFNEFCRALGEKCPTKGDVPAWREIWATVAKIEEAGWMRVKRNGRMTESLQLTKDGADHIRAVLDKQRGLLGLIS